MRTTQLKQIAILAFITLLLSSLPSQADRAIQVIPVEEVGAERRIALVIGNSDYKSSPLRVL